MVDVIIQKHYPVSDQIPLASDTKDSTWGFILHTISWCRKSHATQKDVPTSWLLSNIFRLRVSIDFAMHSIWVVESMQMIYREFKNMIN